VKYELITFIHTFSTSNKTHYLNTLNITNATFLHVCITQHRATCRRIWTHSTAESSIIV